MLDSSNTIKRTMEEFPLTNLSSINFTLTTVTPAPFQITTVDFPLSSEIPLPIDMQFNQGHKMAIFLYALLMMISAVGNLTVLSVIVRLSRKGKLSRINLFLLNLNIADLLITFVMMPLEIVWNRTVSWEAGDGMCRIVSFLRVFGLYLSGFILVCISLDRCISVMKPVVAPVSQNRGIVMLVLAWVGSFICSLPQSFIFHVEAHPYFSWYEQCVTFNSFSSRGMELTYNFFCFFFMYGFPMLMIIICYSCILCKMYCSSGPNQNRKKSVLHPRLMYIKKIASKVIYCLNRGKVKEHKSKFACFATQRKRTIFTNTPTLLPRNTKVK